ncbi:unnamed protein product [Eruca vesicaria subsp. sativa]|uniref:non-specific serine/threonine protein kinase n=1 Tax=Eruca vesicaria subsp. sativa TaxID=29727 RepID=A0ABC8LAM5_ERUVS|nr:unnamed protein product [Eruca vesicaria subsp. sativa]
MDRPAVSGPMDLPIMHDSDRYELVKDIGSGNFGVARLMRDKLSNELVAVKYIERVSLFDSQVVSFHKKLEGFGGDPRVVVATNINPRIVGGTSKTFKKRGRPYATPVGSEPSQIQSNTENRPWLTVGNMQTSESPLLPNKEQVSNQICHRDLKLENTLLDGSPAPRLKICDFGYSKSSVLHSQPKSTVGTPAYIAPEVLLKKEYDGKVADVWSCGVTLYVMLVGAYPFEDPEEPKNFKKTIHRILNVQYAIPDYVHISPECRHLISRIFVADPAKRISIPEIRNHEWFLKNLPADLMNDDTMNSQFDETDQPCQSIEEIMQIIAEATVPAAGTQSLNHYLTGSLDLDDDDMEEDLESDLDDLDIDSSGEIVYAM